MSFVATLFVLWASDSDHEGFRGEIVNGSSFLIEAHVEERDRTEEGLRGGPKICPRDKDPVRHVGIPPNSNSDHRLANRAEFAREDRFIARGYRNDKDRSNGK